jgi:pimeloyl-ACP methyl ester carboxylesterase
MNSSPTAYFAALALSLIGLLAPRAVVAAEPGYQFRTVEGAGGVPLNVVTSGDPSHPAIVFVHGIGQSYLAFENQLNSSLRERYFLVAFDLRGHGSSGKPWTPDAYSDRATWAGDVGNVIRALDLHRPVLVGWSYGTAVVMDFVRVQAAKDIAGVVLTGGYGGLIEPRVGGPPPPAEFVRMRADLAGADLEKRWAASRAMAKFLTARPMPEAWIERAAAQGLLLPPAARAGMFQQPMDNTDLIPTLQSLPMLYLIGGKDSGAPPESDGRELVAKLPQARLIMHPDDGHSLFIESPERFDTELSAFVESLPPGPPRALNVSGNAPQQ